jgi:hypothetical protein
MQREKEEERSEVEKRKPDAPCARNPDEGKRKSESDENPVQLTSSEVA